jgi:hypothetical protein
LRHTCRLSIHAGLGRQRPVRRPTNSACSGVASPCSSVAIARA